MKLDRNLNLTPKRGKYALIKLREVTPLRYADTIAIPTKGIDYGDTPDTDFFVIRMKDKYAGPAFRAYADAARADDPEYAAEIDQLALNAENHPSKKLPD